MNFSLNYRSDQKISISDNAVDDMSMTFKPKKHLQFSSLRKVLTEQLESIMDHRKQVQCTYSIHDTMMSAFACMYFQDPSLLHFQ